LLLPAEPEEGLALLIAELRRNQWAPLKKTGAAIVLAEQSNERAQVNTRAWRVKASKPSTRQNSGHFSCLAC
jgi:ABC-type branched-subunit amino acid transport system ATPase component